MSKADSKKEYQVKFVHWHKSLDPINGIRVFDRNDYFVVYGDDGCNYIAMQFFRTKKCIKQYGDTSTSSSRDIISAVYFRNNIFQSIIKDYVINQNKIVIIYKRSTSISDLNKWIIFNKITPTNISSYSGASSSLSEASFSFISIIIDIRREIKTLGIALYNSSLLSFEIVEFIENTQNYTNLVSLIVAKGVKHCIFKFNQKQNDDDIEAFVTLIKKSSVEIIQKDTKFWTSSNKNQNNNINNVLKKRSIKKLATYTNHNHALNALNAIILHEELLNDSVNFNRYSLSLYKIDLFMRLDAAALNALNLFPTLRDTINNRHNNNNSAHNSLYGVLNKCKSLMGDRLLSIWIRQPLVNIADIHRRQKLIKLFVINQECRDILRNDHFKLLPDLEKLRTKLQSKNKCSLKDLVDLYNFAEKLPWIKDTLNTVKNVDFDDGNDDNNDNKDADDDIDINKPSTITPLNLLQNDYIQPLNEIELNFNNYLAMIEQVVDLAATSHREYLIKHSFDALLDKYAKKKIKLYNDMEKLKNDAFKILKFDKIKNLTIDKHKSWGYCLRVTNSASNKGKKIKKNGDDHGYEILSKTKNAVFFTTSSFRLKSKSHLEYSKKYIERQKTIVDKTIEITQTYTPVIDKSIKIFSELDVILSLSHIAATSTNTYCLPKILPDGPNKERKIIMKNARHPCLELIQYTDGVVPNDVSLISSSSSFQIITGPNMGGKSTYIRMIGVIVLLAQIGSYVPCDSCTISIVDSILARVGAGDNQLRGVSTFMAEMLETSSILESCTSSSLIIIDELGRGTSTYDGYGIAYSISEYIASYKKSFCLFATHFHELTSLNNLYCNIVNKHVSASFNKKNDSLTMLYKIMDGACPQSFGIQVAKLAKFPDNVINDAKDKANQLELKNNKSFMQANTYKLIQNILNKHNIILNDIKSNKLNKNSKIYCDKMEQLVKFIQDQADKNDELNELCLICEEEQKKDDNNNNKINLKSQSDKMELE